MHIVITGGGTGGHIFPALEIAKEFRELNSRTKISYVGNQGGLEERMAQHAGFSFIGLRVRPILGQSFVKKVTALFYLALALVEALWFLIKNRPDAVIGVGGYVSAPMIVASFLLRINRYICEQNVVPGLANKWLAQISNKVFISFAKSKQYFSSHNTVFTGNPIRKQFFSINHIEHNHTLNILVAGGSMGASFLNHEVPKAIALIKEVCEKISVTHQTGSAKLSEAQETYKNAHIEAKVVAFIDNMPEAFRSHDLLVSRAGATVAAEIMAAGMPAILVPYRFANGHQKDNALALAQHGSAVMIEENSDFSEKLSGVIKEFYLHREKLCAMGLAAKKLATPKAASAIAKSVISDLA